jgi:hypothetical protein
MGDCVYFKRKEKKNFLKKILKTLARLKMCTFAPASSTDTAGVKRNEKK